MKRVLTVQDISCLGKCSITIALPVISALGSETVILPTALLSTHSIFENFTCKDLSDQIMPIAQHWQSQDVKFDAIYTGYLGTMEEIDMMKEIVRMFGGEDTLVIVDPAMGDKGVLYPAFDEAYALKNRELCGIADIVLPNITEASFMTGLPYKEEYDEAYVKEMLQALHALGAEVSILTGVSLEPGKTGIMGYDSRNDSYFSYQNEKIGAQFHGTGDLFASTFVGEVMKGLDWTDAIRIAADYTAHTIAVTMENPKKSWYGVDFETTIPDLINMK
ncbi:MAG: pyridoxamine kinase [Firmicutes bacterium]|nr:pyridoxamine kinase [Bacillota bacterium]